MKLNHNKKSVKISRSLFMLYAVHGVRHCFCPARLCRQ